MTRSGTRSGRFDPARGWFDDDAGWFEVVFESDSETSAQAAERRLDRAEFDARILAPADTGVRRRWFVAVPEERAGKARKALRRERERRQSTTAWEPVWQGDGEAAAVVVADALRVRGIDARPVGARQIGGGGYPHAWQRGTWAVIVRARDAAAARDALDATGEDANLVYGPTDPVAANWRIAKVAIPLALLALTAAAAISLLTR
ncbi:MAG: hypothetical protein IT303_14790 [Dehalococcoidia bacterium]|nr:hypothetical protein [Dehalococcoidia bacterium]